MVRYLSYTALAAVVIVAMPRHDSYAQGVNRQRSKVAMTAPKAPPAPSIAPPAPPIASTQEATVAPPALPTPSPKNAPGGARTAAPQSRASLGVAMSDNTRGGVLILRVLPGTPAAAVGLQTGDRIMAIGGVPVSNYRDVARLIAGYRPNARAELRIDRGGWTRTIPVTLGDANLLALPVASAAAPQTAPPSVAPGSLLMRPEFENESPADIDDQHGYGG